MVLAGSDTYTGGTTVEGGTLIVEYPWSIDANGAGTSLSVGSPTLLKKFGIVQSAGNEATVATPVPEPGTFGLLAAVVTAGAAACRRKVRGARNAA